MRRADKGVTDKQWLNEILNNGQIIHLGLSTSDGEPYVLPMGYGYEDGVLYIHGANTGKKNDMIAENPRISFNVSLDTEVVRDAVGSEFSMKYKSVTGSGRATEITKLDDKNSALKVIMGQYDGPHTDLTDGNQNSVWVVRIDISHITGKVSGYPKPEA